MQAGDEDRTGRGGKTEICKIKRQDERLVSETIRENWGWRLRKIKDVSMFKLKCFSNG